MVKATVILFLASVTAVGGALQNGRDWRIVGGETAEVGQFPYQISLRKGREHECGGSILNRRWILTAAHCVKGKHPTSLTAVTGTNKLSTGGDFYPVEYIKIHEKFGYGLKNDIALLKVSKDIKMNDRVKSIEINTEEIEGGKDLVLSGWGKTSFPGSIPDDLQIISLKSITNKKCKEMLHNIDKTQICTLMKIGKGVCYGDSGGPLVYKGKVAGIVSWVKVCALAYPDVFTRVSAYIDWIQENTKTTCK